MGKREGREKRGVERACVKGAVALASQCHHVCRPACPLKSAQRCPPGVKQSRSRRAFSPLTSCLSSMAGKRRYDAVATGDHLACSCESKSARV